MPLNADKCPQFRTAAPRLWQGSARKKRVCRELLPLDSPHISPRLCRGILTRQAEPGAFAGWLGREEGLEQFVTELWRDADAIVMDPDFDRGAEVARRNLQHWAERGVRCAAALVRLGGGACQSRVRYHSPVARVGASWRGDPVGPSSRSEFSRSYHSQWHNPIYHCRCHQAKGQCHQAKVGRAGEVGSD
jgi:hypothetical protein